MKAKGEWLMASGGQELQSNSREKGPQLERVKNEEKEESEIDRERERE